MLAQLEQILVLGGPVEVHGRLDELGPQGIDLAIGRRFAGWNVKEFGQEAVLLPHANVAHHRAHGGLCVAHDTQYARPEGLERLEDGQRHLALVHAHPHIPIVLSHVLVNGRPRLGEQLQQLGAIQQDGPLDQILEQGIDAGADARVQSRPTSALHIDVIAKESNGRASLPERIDRLEGHLLVYALAREPAQSAELHQKGAHARRTSDGGLAIGHAVSQIDRAVRHARVRVEGWQQTPRHILGHAQQGAGAGPARLHIYAGATR